MSLEPGASIRLLPSTLYRVPFDRLPSWRTLGTVRRVIGREPGRVLVEIELDGYVGVVWDFEVREVKG